MFVNKEDGGTGLRSGVLAVVVMVLFFLCVLFLIGVVVAYVLRVFGLDVGWVDGVALYVMIWLVLLPVRWVLRHG